LQPLRRYRVQTKAGHALFGGAWLRECVSCGLVQAVPRPDAERLDDYYATAYWKKTHPATGLVDVQRFPRDNLALFNRGRSIAELVTSHVRSGPKRILDVGAGYGHVLHALGELYADATRVAIESSGQCQRHLQSLDVEVVREPIEEFLLRLKDPFDVIVLSHVLEHFGDPGSILAMLRAALSPEGILCLEVPNVPAESGAGFLNHPWTSPFDEPHVTFFSASTLAALVKRAGYDVLLCETVGPTYRGVSQRRLRLPSMRSALRRIVPRGLLPRLRRQRGAVPERDESFYQYGGPRIWIRCVASRDV
jgi:2-polyprenyl-3-methyl-5-hydroxy-6-metoxy-1,4-benzoquinol methylase